RAPCLYFSFFLLPLPPPSTLFPYTTLFRSGAASQSPRARKRDRACRGGSDCCERDRARRRSPSPRAPRVGAAASAPRTNARSGRSEEHTSELQSRENLVCRLLLEKKKKNKL